MNKHGVSFRYSIPFAIFLVAIFLLNFSNAAFAASVNTGNNPGNPNAAGYNGDLTGSTHAGTGIAGGDRTGARSYGGSADSTNGANSSNRGNGGTNAGTNNGSNNGARSGGNSGGDPRGAPGSPYGTPNNDQGFTGHLANGTPSRSVPSQLNQGVSRNPASSDPRGSMYGTPNGDNGPTGRLANGTPAQNVPSTLNKEYISKVAKEVATIDPFSKSYTPAERDALSRLDSALKTSNGKKSVEFKGVKVQAAVNEDVVNLAQALVAVDKTITNSFLESVAKAWGFTVEVTSKYGDIGVSVPGSCTACSPSVSLGMTNNFASFSGIKTSIDAYGNKTIDIGIVAHELGHQLMNNMVEGNPAMMDQAMAAFKDAQVNPSYKTSYGEKAYALDSLSEYVAETVRVYNNVSILPESWIAQGAVVDRASLLARDPKGYALAGAIARGSAAITGNPAGNAGQSSVPGGGRRGGGASGK